MANPDVLVESRFAAYKEFWSSTEPLIKENLMDVVPVFRMMYKDIFRNEKLYIRQCCVDIEKLIEEAYNSPPQDQVRIYLVTGTPGVGKSIFLLYMLYKVRQRRSVFVQIGKRTWAFLAPSASAEASVLMSPQGDLKYSLLEDPSMLYFYDPGDVGRSGNVDLCDYANTFTVVFSSTCEGNYRPILKHDHVKVYMPVWSYEEIQICRAECYPWLTEAEVKDRYDMWGGSPRSIFVTYKSNEERLEQFLCSQSLDLVIADLEQKNTAVRPNDPHQWLVHVSVPGEDYTAHTLGWPSQYVLGKVRLVLNEREQYDKEKYQHSILHGQIYESAVLEEMKKPNLHTVSAFSGERVEIPITENVKFFTNTSEIANLSPSTLYIPVECNKKTIDFVKGKWIFQATLSKKHKINARGIEDLTKTTGVQAWNFCWVVPKERFDGFKLQPIEGSLVGIEIKQYKLSML